MNITEAATTQRVLAFVAGDVDHCDETTRAAIADDIAYLQTRARMALKAGTWHEPEWWDERLCRITFEGD